MALAVDEPLDCPSLRRLAEGISAVAADLDYLDNGLPQQLTPVVLPAAPGNSTSPFSHLRTSVLFPKPVNLTVWGIIPQR